MPTSSRRRWTASSCADGEVGEIAEHGHDPVPRRPAEAVARRRRRQRGRHSAGEVGPDRAAAHRCFRGPAAAKARVSEITPMGDPRHQDVSRPHRAARRYAAAGRHERRGQHRHAREARRASRAGRRRAGQRRLRDRRRPRAAAHGRDRHPRHAHGGDPVGLARRRPGRLAGAAGPRGRHARARASTQDGGAP